MIADYLATKLASVGYPTNGENVWAVLRRFRAAHMLDTQDAWAAYLAPLSTSDYLHDDFYIWATTHSHVPAVLVESLFTIDAAAPNGGPPWPPIPVPAVLVESLFTIDAAAPDGPPWAPITVPAALVESLFVIDAAAPDGPPLADTMPLLGASFWIDATREPY